MSDTRSKFGEKSVANEETEFEEVELFKTVTFSRTPVNKSEKNMKGLKIEIPSSPKFEEVSENNPEFGLPEVVNTSTPGLSK